MLDFKIKEIEEYIANVEIPNLGISTSTNEDLQNKEFNQWLGDETKAFMQWYDESNFQGLTFYTRPTYQSTFTNRLRGKFIEVLMIRYLEKFSDCKNEHVGLTDYYATTENGPVIVEIKTLDYYDDNAASVIPMTDFKGADLTKVPGLYLLDVEFDKATGGVAFASLINLSHTTVIANHKYQDIGIKKPNYQLQNGKDTLLVQTKSNKEMHAVGGHVWEVPYEGRN